MVRGGWPLAPVHDLIADQAILVPDIGDEQIGWLLRRGGWGGRDGARGRVCGCRCARRREGHPGHRHLEAVRVIRVKGPVFAVDLDVVRAADQRVIFDDLGGRATAVRLADEVAVGPIEVQVEVRGQVPELGADVLTSSHGDPVVIHALGVADGRPVFGAGQQEGCLLKAVVGLVVVGAKARCGCWRGVVDHQARRVSLFFFAAAEQQAEALLWGGDQHHAAVGLAAVEPGLHQRSDVPALVAGAQGQSP